MKKQIIAGLLALGALMGIGSSQAMEAPEVMPYMYESTLITLGFGNIEQQEFTRSKQIVKGTKAAIVNAAKPTLNGGGGVDGAIHKAAGQGGHSRQGTCLVCKEFEGKTCSVGNAVCGTCHKINNPKDYDIDHIIHAVGPDCSQNKNKLKATDEQCQQLANAYYNSLQCAVNAGITHIAFPQISVGIYAFPHRQAVNIVVDTIKTFIDENQGKLKHINLVMYNDDIGRAGYDLYKQSLEKLEEQSNKSGKHYSFFKQYKMPIIFGEIGLGIIATALIASIFSK
jgi:O-acetyl-ADP-ribose deacetylase (regulator of RNase III)